MITYTYKDLLVNVISLIEDQNLKQFTLGCLENMPDFATAPGASGHHHAYKGGLVQHTTEVCLLAGNIADTLAFSPKSKNILLCGAVLHDIGKAQEYALSDKEVPYVTTQGKLLGHILLGLMYVSKRMEAGTAVSDADKLHILHMIASHHGKKEWGSPKVPATREAYVLHMADMLSSRDETAVEGLNAASETGKNFTPYNSGYETCLWDGVHMKNYAHD